MFENFMLIDKVNKTAAEFHPQSAVEATHGRMNCRINRMKKPAHAGSGGFSRWHYVARVIISLMNANFMSNPEYGTG